MHAAGDGKNLYMDGVLLISAGYYYKSGTEFITQPHDSTPNAGYISSGSCNACPTINTYNCVNGACVPDVTGIYKSLSECEVNCGTNRCSGKCISNSDWAAIEGLSHQLRNRNCGCKSCGHK
ncbi:MAG: hypothetical protein RM368_29625 [Nostoc sp. DedSLP03]|uniref:hypothetical protein n=1 Tax=Nostoc sp. DedSLP03 TaxID=3075400 RepID=UPI002AD217BA|nr:hypothetical protein [Nostoc sp. DedSLP03]MDZ7969065.1 hypothetical protein [Nostoc sp. DedSLP03]